MGHRIVLVLTLILLGITLFFGVFFRGTFPNAMNYVFSGFTVLILSTTLAWGVAEFARIRKPLDELLLTVIFAAGLSVLLISVFRLETLQTVLLAAIVHLCVMGTSFSFWSFAQRRAEMTPALRRRYLLGFWLRTIGYVGIGLFGCMGALLILLLTMRAGASAQFNWVKLLGTSGAAAVLYVPARLLLAGIREENEV